MSSENLGEATTPERTIAVDASLITGILIMIPVMVFSTALGFFVNMWLFWTVPALAGLALWAVLFSKVRAQLSESTENTETEEAIAGFGIEDIDDAQNKQLPTQDSAKSA